MIVLKSLRWSYAFSYGKDNYIDFSSHDLIQLIGKNGHGKSSIALILEEVLYNKNSKNIKKADILNRNCDSSKYNIELTFSKDNDDYKIITTRGVTQQVQLFKNGEDHSAHTATSTYKIIEEIMGMDHKTFTQIVYQSSSYSLEFLTATDTNRKKFLIDLLNLSIYTRASELFKDLYREINLELDSLQVKVNTISDWLYKLTKEDLVKKELVKVPEPPTKKVNEATELREQLRNIEHTNKRISQNNKYKEILESIPLDSVMKPTEDINALKVSKIGTQQKINNLQVIIRDAGGLKDFCDACGQPIDNTHKKLILEDAKHELPNWQAELEEINRIITKVEKDVNHYNKVQQNIQEWERYHSLIDPTMTSVLLDRTELESKLTALENIISNTEKDIIKAQDINNKASAHNARVDVLNSQMETMQRDLDSFTLKLNTLQRKATNIQLLVKTFSTTGLVAYKIECLVKDLELITNEYLVDMSDGRFQLSFKVNSSDKLNVVINDNGIDIDILALSNGERARVNISTLLAIRKLMQTLSDSRINLLFLDETIEGLDSDGKERLIEVLLKEEHLNTILVSHSFTHPLINKLYIVKENNISRIE